MAIVSALPATVALSCRLSGELRPMLLVSVRYQVPEFCPSVDTHACVPGGMIIDPPVAPPENASAALIANVIDAVSALTQNPKPLNSVFARANV